ncbi:MAG: hypothetical protein H6867_10420 [Rhodospirillales bacterium]|nr:hypothetical protein [Rhodospirillales bacterium]MCB9995802.1 hypothetical protein [Rhodospirillales bacterium]
MASDPFKTLTALFAATLVGVLSAPHIKPLFFEKVSLQEQDGKNVQAYRMAEGRALGNITHAACDRDSRTCDVLFKTGSLDPEESRQCFKVVDDRVFTRLSVAIENRDLFKRLRETEALTEIRYDELNVNTSCGTSDEPLRGTNKLLTGLIAPAIKI